MFLLLLLMFILIFADQFTKWLAVVHLRESGSFVIIEDVLELTYHENPGAAWGMLQDHRWVFMVTSVVAITGILIFLCKCHSSLHPVLKIALSLIVAGGAANMIDRVLLGYVVDFISFVLINFPIFNVADMCVTVGAGLMIAWLLFFDLPAGVKEENAKKKLSGAADGKAGEDK